MFKAIRTIKKIKQLQKAMHDASVAFYLCKTSVWFLIAKRAEPKLNRFMI